MARRFIAFLCATFLTGTLPQPLQAYALYDGNMLLNTCENKDSGEFGRFYCDAYIRGAFERYFVELVRRFQATPECIPWSATNQQIRDVVLKYLRDHPEQRHRFAAQLIETAMAEAFGTCTK